VQDGGLGEAVLRVSTCLGVVGAQVNGVSLWVKRIRGMTMSETDNDSMIEVGESQKRLDCLEISPSRHR